MSLYFHWEGVHSTVRIPIMDRSVVQPSMSKDNMENDYGTVYPFP